MGENKPMPDGERGHRGRFPLGAAAQVAREIRCLLETHCRRIEIAGSIRRRKPEVGDVEILAIPTFRKIVPPGELSLVHVEENVTETRVAELLKKGILEPRLKINGTKTMGPRVKLFTHIATGIPVDLFLCDEEGWVNNLVSRTGGKETNIAIASRAKARGWSWLPFGAGFQNQRSGEIHQPETEEDVLGFVGLPPMKPEERP
jgi:DNA polymerase/3'-5' exonuclease PolX